MIAVRMAKDPAFLFYPNDYLGGTMGFTLEQHGAYLLLLILQFNNGPFTAEQAHKIVCESVFKTVKQKFTEKDGFFANERIEFEVKKRKKYSESRAKNRKNKVLKKKHMKNICSGAGNSYVKHMENENENENRNRNALKEGDCKGEKKHKHGEYQHVLLTDEQFNKLNEKIGEKQTAEMITELDNGIEMKGYKYKNHYLAILKWYNRRGPEKNENQKTNNSGHEHTGGMYASHVGKYTRKPGVEYASPDDAKKALAEIQKKLEIKYSMPK